MEKWVQDEKRPEVYYPITDDMQVMVGLAYIINLPTMDISTLMRLPTPLTKQSYPLYLRQGRRRGIDEPTRRKRILRSCTRRSA
jgi:hypothetical protein